MVSTAAFRKMALSFDDTDEHPHFNRQAFRVHAKIFATLLAADRTAMLVLPPATQSVYCDYDGASFTPAQGAWGKKGCTYVDLRQVKTTVCKEALQAAYNDIAAKHLPKKKKSASGR